jgi:hypothetical protein
LIQGHDLKSSSASLVNQQVVARLRSRFEGPKERSLVVVFPSHINRHNERTENGGSSEIDREGEI